MSQTVSQHLLNRLHEWGVRRIFGYPGDGINGLMGALRGMQDKLDFVQARHEELAAFMACGHAKFTGQVGVCMATSGPGAIHLLNGLYDAKMDNQPVVAIIGQQARTSLGSEFQQEVDLVSLFKDVAGAFVQMATVPEQIRHLVDRAVRTARDQRTVTCIILPNDLQDLPAVPEPRPLSCSGQGARAEGLGAVALAVNRELGQAPAEAAMVDPDPDQADHDRITVRMPAFLMAAMKGRAKSQGMAPSRMAALVQSTLTRHPVLTEVELQAVEATTRKLSAIGRNINQIARALNEAHFQTDRVRLDRLAELGEKINSAREAIRVLVRASRNAWRDE